MDTDFKRNLHVFESPKFRSVVEEAIQFFNATPLRKLPPSRRFIGTGVYALYYLGEHELYAPMGKLNAKKCIHPIYVGKAVPRGWRTGRKRDSNAAVLHGRIREHSRSISQTNDLAVDEFRCRFMILENIESDLVVPVEAELIRLYQPIWNVLIDGFGNHDPGSGRYDQAPSEWDTLHSGRKWANRLRGTKLDKNLIIAKVINHLRKLDFS